MSEQPSTLDMVKRALSSEYVRFSGTDLGIPRPVGLSSNWSKPASPLEVDRVTVTPAMVLQAIATLESLLKVAVERTDEDGESIKELEAENDRREKRIAELEAKDGSIIGKLKAHLHLTEKVVDLAKTWCRKSGFTLKGDGIGNDMARALSNLDKAQVRREG